MDIYIVVCQTQHRLTRAFTTERRAQAYVQMLERDGLVCHIVFTRVNKEYYNGTS